MRFIRWFRVHPDWLLYVGTALIAAIAMAGVFELGGGSAAAIVALSLASLFVLISIVQGGRVGEQHIEIDTLHENMERQEQRDRELARANERLREIDKMKSDFITVATHQLRTPLSAIRWTISMLLNGDAGQLSVDQRTLLMKAYESNSRMLQLLNDMLLADRIEGDPVEGKNAVALLPDLAENLRIEMDAIAQKKQIKLRFEYSDHTYPQVAIDPRQLRAVLQNLVENAIKYTPKGGIVTLHTRLDGSMIEITVADTGIGIPKVDMEHIFSRFFRAANAVRVETDGSGLGLFIVKSIVEKNDGEISFTSAEGKGTTFTVRLPISKKAPQ